MTDLDRESLYHRGMYRGAVLDNADPDKLGRVKVRVFGVFTEDIPTAAIPWAVPAMPLFAGAGAGYGCFAVPEVGSHVFVFFEAGDIYQPVYFAEAPDGVHGLPTERTANYPDRKVFKTANGIVIYIDDSAKTLKLTLPSGGTITVGSSGDVTISANANVGGNVEADGTIESGDGYIINGTPGVDGTFTSKDDKSITVEKGIITQIM